MSQHSIGTTTAPRTRRPWLALLACAAAAFAAGCSSGGEDTSNSGTGIVVNPATAIAQQSADDYNANVNGLITGATLKGWISDWVNNRPAGITGKLVIFQAAAGEATYEYIKPNNTTVFTYLSPSSDWTQTRSNGVVTTASMVPDGATMDALFKKYNVDPQHDMIVCAQGAGSPGNAMAQGRCWYALRYWGVDARNLAILNGGNAWQVTGTAMAVTDFQATASTAPNSGSATVKDLKADNTALQATLEDMLAILPSSDTNVRADGVFLWDARNLGQYSAREKIENGEDTDTATAGTQACATAYCDPVEDPVNYMSTFQNSGSRQGHPWGTLQLQFTRLLDSTQGYSYKPKAELAAYLNGELDANGMGFVDSSYTPVAAGGAYQPGDTVYTYCETTFRAMITGVVSGVILGKPTRFYDGAMTEWNSLSNLQDRLGNYILPYDSRWRTDVKSFFREASSSTLVAPRIINDAYAPSANTIIHEDKLYKMPASTGSGGGSGGAPANPCG